LIVEHANKNVINYPLAIVNALGIKRVAYWGHGRNRQGNPNSLSERFKNRSLHWADWWFAYTAGAAEYVASQGFDAKRITSVGNAVDTKVLRAEVAAVSNAERAALLEELKWGPSVTRLVYCGSLYGNKRLDLLLLAAEAVQARIPTLQLLVMGGGPQANEVSRFAATRPWVRYVGPQFGRRKAAMLSLAQLWVNPGLVGLGILDAFSAGLPIVTTDVPVHSPEIEYLVHGVNGLMVPATVADLAAALEALLRDPEQVQRLRDGARASADHYSIETMVDNFAQGVLQWLRS
jgi:glycosyltransferase involved in cell wall biosynthesis